MVHRTARIGLRLTRAQRQRCFGLLRSAADVWACTLEINQWRLRRGDRPVAGYQQLCRLLSASGPGSGDIGLHAQTGHPCAVVPYKFEPQTSRPFTGGRPDTTAAPVTYNPQPICAVMAGNLYNDDLVLSVAHKYQVSTDWHNRHPKL